MTAPVRAIPEGMHTITPHLFCEGAAEAIEFYKKAFNAVELSRLPGPDGKIMHAQLRIGDSALMLCDAVPQCGGFGALALKGSPVTIHLYVPDVDAIYAQAVKAGATARMPVEDMFWGDRYGMLVDPFGHHWSVATHKRDLTPEQIKEGMAKLPPRAA